MIKIPPKLAFGFGILTTIMMLIGGGTVALPLGIPHESADVIKSWCMFLGAINSALLTAAAGYSSAVAGPLVAPPSQAEAIQQAMDQKRPSGASVGKQ